MAYSIGVINLLGVIAMLLFPLLGSMLELDARVYGAWSPAPQVSILPTLNTACIRHNWYQLETNSDTQRPLHPGRSVPRRLPGSRRQQHHPHSESR